MGSSWFLPDTAPKTNPAATCTRIRAIARNLNSIHLDSFLASINLVPQHCASAVNKITITGYVFCSLSALYRDTRSFDQTLYLDGKNHAVPSFSGRKKSSTKEPGQVVGRNCVG